MKRGTCKNCGRAIYQTATGMWVHEHNMTAGCNYGRTKAEPR